jgi:hypothetical protein
MKGHTLDLTLPDILLLLGMQSRTGELVVESGNNIGTVLLHQGKILQAFSPYSRAIGDLLVEEGLITDSELLETLKVQKMNAYAPLGALLLKTGKVTFEVIEMMVHEQIRQAIKEFRGWNTVSFSFTQKDIVPFDRIHLAAQEFIPFETVRAAKTFLLHEKPVSSASAA